MQKVKIMKSPNRVLKQIRLNQFYDLLNRRFEQSIPKSNKPTNNFVLKDCPYQKEFQIVWKKKICFLPDTNNLISNVTTSL